MSDIVVNVNFRALKGNLLYPFNPGTIQEDFDAVAPLRGGHAQTVGFAADEVLDVGDVANLGWSLWRNLDETNYVEFGPTSGGVLIPFGRLYPGQAAIIPLSPSIVPRAQANTAAVGLDFTVLDK